MIIDRLDNWDSYFVGDAGNKVLEFLMSLTPDTDEGEYHLQGDEIFARVMSYETRHPEAAVLEAHRKYVDIQTVLDGAEGFEWFPTDGLSADIPYDESKDAEFYKRPHSGPARVDLCPGIFVVFFPQDAHMPSLVVGDAVKLIKKVVVKVNIELWVPGRIPSKVNP